MWLVVRELAAHRGIDRCKDSGRVVAAGRATRCPLGWGHLPPAYAAVIRELIAWTDQWLGPVPLSGSAARQDP